MGRIKFIMAAMTFALIAAGCSDDNEPAASDGGTKTDNNTPRIELNLTAQQQTALDRSMNFGFNIFNKICAEKTSGNVTISPLSISMALSMLANGAEGNTLTEILDALGYNGDATGLGQLNDVNSILLTALPSTDPNAKVALTNSIWIDPGFPINSSYKENLASLYGAAVENVSLGTQSGIDRFNNWCAENTGNLIKEMYGSPLSVDVLIANAVYFKGIWEEPFKEENTKKEDFIAENGRPYKVDMMSITHEMEAVETEDFLLAKKPMGNEAFNMVFILPNNGKKLSETLSNLTAESYREMNDGIEKRTVSLKLPRLSITERYDLTGYLKAMGITDAFSGAADFSKISTGQLYINSADHQVSMSVDEEGAVAAAVTGFGWQTSTGQEFDTTMYVHLNRPFVLLIEEATTNAVLIMAKIDRF